MEDLEQKKDVDTLICPRCSDRLQPMLLKIERDEKDGLDYQTIWWTCRGLKKKTCIFPLNMPTNVFWTRRTTEQMRQCLLPLPNIHLLPPDLHYLYPKIFKSVSEAKNVEKISKIAAFARPENNSQLNENMETTLPAPLFREPTHAEIPSIMYQNNALEEEIPDLSDRIKYGEADSRRNVELFADPSSADSTLFLRYATDTFLSSINSEMSRKKLITPPLAISHKQRVRVSNYVEKIREAWSNYEGTQTSPATSAAYDTRIVNRKTRKRKMLDFNIPSALKKFDASERAKSLSMRLGISETQSSIHEESIPYHTPVIENDNLVCEGEREVVYEPPSQIHSDSPFVNVPECGTSDTNTSSHSATSSATSQIRRDGGISASRLPSLGDPELDNLLQQKYREIITREKFTKRKQDDDRPDSQDPQIGSQADDTLQHRMDKSRQVPNSAVQHGALISQNGHANGNGNYAYLNNFDPNTFPDFPDYTDDLSYGLDLF
ncbi:hypothetical protein Ddc_00943 [Ditylenchus destructor]|nr:hypothetical protein Ddc_00943 [Ditylenchus destructor]